MHLFHNESDVLSLKIMKIYIFVSYVVFKERSKQKLDFIYLFIQK
jgi:hypothetical protein